MPPRELIPIEAAYEEDPVVTILEPARHVELEYAEPSIVMGVFSRAWRRLIFLLKAATVIIIVGAYPAMTVSSHHVDDSEIQFADGYEWSVGEVGITVTLIARILEGPGWASDSAVWHPHARLTAMPAWQEGIASSTSDFTHLLAAQMGNEDISAAARLMAPQPDAMSDRLTAAAEILAKYDSRVENGHAKAPKGAKALQEKLDLTAAWAKTSRAELAQQARTPEAWPASYQDIRVFYQAKARAHVAHEMLKAAVTQNNETIGERGLADTSTEALELWRKAAIQEPLFVANQSGDGAFLGSHLTSMAFLMDEAATATRILSAGLSKPVVKQQPPRSAELAASAPPSP